MAHLVWKIRRIAMGFDVRGNLVIGVPVTRADFFAKTGFEHRCERGHIRAAGSTARFCEQDGSRFSKEAVEDPTPQFKAWAEEFGVPPNKLWDDLNEICGADPNASGVFCVDAVSSCEGSESMALGLHIAETDSACGSSDVDTLGFTLEFVAGKMEEAEKLARHLGIGRKAQLFLNVYASY
jgi:hypothetical protein